MEYTYWILATLGGILFSAIVIHLAAVIVGPSDRGFWAAFITALILYVLAHIALIPFIIFTAIVIPWWVFIVIAFLIALFVIHRVYSTSFGAAFVMWLIAVVFNTVYSLLFYGPVIVRVVNLIRIAAGREPL